MGVTSVASLDGVKTHRALDRRLKHAERQDRSMMNAMSPEELLNGLAISDEDAHASIGRMAQVVRSEWLALLKDAMIGQMLMRTHASSRDDEGRPISNLPPLTVVVNTIRPYAHELSCLDSIVATVTDELTGKESVGAVSQVRKLAIMLWAVLTACLLVVLPPISHAGNTP